METPEPTAASHESAASTERPTTVVINADEPATPATSDERVVTVTTSGDTAQSAQSAQRAGSEDTTILSRSDGESDSLELGPEGFAEVTESGRLVRTAALSARRRVELRVYWIAPMKASKSGAGR